MTADCHVVVTPEGLARECVDPDLRTISYESMSVGPGADTAPTQSVDPILFAAQRMVWARLQRQLRVEDDAVDKEADGFVLAYERPLELAHEVDELALIDWLARAGL